MTRYYDEDYYAIRGLATAELERTKRELRVSASLVTPGSPMHAPIQAYLQAIDTELAERAGKPDAEGIEPA